MRERDMARMTALMGRRGGYERRDTESTREFYERMRADSSGDKEKYLTLLHAMDEYLSLPWWKRCLIKST